MFTIKELAFSRGRFTTNTYNTSKFVQGWSRAFKTVNGLGSENRPRRLHRPVCMVFHTCHSTDRSTGTIMPSQRSSWARGLHLGRPSRSA